MMAFFRVAFLFSGYVWSSILYFGSRAERMSLSVAAGRQELVTE